MVTSEENKDDLFDRLEINLNRKSLLLLIRSIEFKQLECYCIIYGNEANQKYMSEIQVRIIGKFNI